MKLNDPLPIQRYENICYPDYYERFVKNGHPARWNHIVFQDANETSFKSGCNSLALFAVAIPSPVQNCTLA